MASSDSFQPKTSFVQGVWVDGSTLKLCLWKYIFEIKVVHQFPRYGILMYSPTPAGPIHMQFKTIQLDPNLITIKYNTFTYLQPGPITYQLKKIEIETEIDSWSLKNLLIASPWYTFGLSKHRSICTRVPVHECNEIYGRIMCEQKNKILCGTYFNREFRTPGPLCHFFFHTTSDSTQHTGIHCMAVILRSADYGFVGGKSTSVLFQFKE